MLGYQGYTNSYRTVTATVISVYTVFGISQHPTSHYYCIPGPFELRHSSHSHCVGVECFNG